MKLYHISQNDCLVSVKHCFRRWFF